MSDIQPLRHSVHGSKRWLANADYRFAADVLMVPVALEELAAASVSLPLAFAKGPTTSLIALTGLQQGKNVFVGPDGRWLGDYMPAVLRGFPFKLLPATEGKWALGFDHASGLIASGVEGEAFFTSEGKPTDAVQKTFNFLIRINSGLEQATKAVAMLSQHELLEPWPLKLKDGDIEIPVAGLLRVSETKLAALDAETFASLRSDGVLALAYAQLLSMANIDKLGKLARLQAHHAAQHALQADQVKSMFSADKHEDEIDWDAMLKDD
ncbi:SapC protein [Devosia crocina]|uniref:SapC protein n=1 Tax=Devosia crocina TaxID=429728 RepID=A0A1I7MWL5_9HYPH|nr:SapC family protein [Devosia crocina]SFV26764.1 SapC protein [Devosia crocina]